MHSRVVVNSDGTLSYIGPIIGIVKRHNEDFVDVIYNGGSATAVLPSEPFEGCHAGDEAVFRLNEHSVITSVHVNGRLVYTAPGMKKRPGIDDYRRALAIMAKKYCLYPDVAFENALEEAMEKVPD